jgi:predicted ester cyclase
MIASNQMGESMRTCATIIALLLASNLAFGQTAPTPSADTAAKNKAFVLGCMELMNQKKIDAYMECWANDVTNNTRVNTREGVRRTVLDIFNTFPDFHWQILGATAEGDTVVIETMQIGTHRGVATTGFNGGGLLGVAATGKRMEIRAMHKWVIKDGKVIQQQAVREDLVMMRQLGLVPPAPQTPAR